MIPFYKGSLSLDSTVGLFLRSSVQCHTLTTTEPLHGSPWVSPSQHGAQSWRETTTKHSSWALQQMLSHSLKALHALSPGPGTATSPRTLHLLSCSRCSACASPLPALPHLGAGFPNLLAVALWLSGNTQGQRLLILLIPPVPRIPQVLP